MKKPFILLAFLLTACANKSDWVAGCQTHDFNTQQCNFLYSKRHGGVSINAPVIGGIIGINMP